MGRASAKWFASRKPKATYKSAARRAAIIRNSKKNLDLIARDHNYANNRLEPGAHHLAECGSHSVNSTVAVNVPSQHQNVIQCTEEDITNAGGGDLSGNSGDGDFLHSKNLMFGVSQEEYESIMNHGLCVERVESGNAVILGGKRIVDIEYVMRRVAVLQQQHSRKCTCGILLPFKEKREFLVSHITLKCNFCDDQYKISTEDQKANQKSTTNIGAVWGTLSSGMTYGQMEEFLSVLDIPTMSSYAYAKIEKDLGDAWKDALWKDMEDAGKMELDFAIENGDVDDDGVPFITVYTDGGWSKRSYGHNFNANSGVAVIIGKATGKLLFLGVRNKYCSICARAANKRITPGTHLCFRNWNGSSSAMEADIVIEGFNKSVELHGVRYKKFIADGDSSVFARIRQNVSYGTDVIKMECLNHVIKNYGKALIALKKDPNVDKRAKKLLTMSKINSLQKHAQYHIKMNNGDMVLLKNKLKNTFNHNFGDHANCDEVCQPDGESQVPLLKSSGLLLTLLGILEDKIIKNLWKLMDHENNNKSECFMSILAKYNCGKRINFSNRGSFNLKCYLSGLRYNEGMEWQRECWKGIFQKSPGKQMKNLISRHTKDKEARAKKRLLMSANSNQKPIPEILPKIANVDYGKKALQAALTAEELEFNKMSVLENLQVTFQEQQSIAEETVEQFASNRYKKERQNRLTASNFGEVIKLRESTSCHNVVNKILYGNEVRSAAIDFGKINESKVRSLLSQGILKNNYVREAGFFVDLKHGFLGATPDGLVDEDYILEIKCLHSVYLSGLSLVEAVEKDQLGKQHRLCLQINNGQLTLKRNHNYFYQIQGQLHVTQKTGCLFVIYIGDKYPLYIEEIMRDDDFWKSQMESKLIRFYKECMLPEIVLKNIPNGLACQDPPYIVEAKKNVKKKVPK